VRVAARVAVRVAVRVGAGRCGSPRTSDVGIGIGIDFGMIKSSDSISIPKFVIRNS